MTAPGGRLVKAGPITSPSPSSPIPSSSSSSLSSSHPHSRSRSHRSPRSVWNEGDGDEFDWSDDSSSDDDYDQLNDDDDETNSNSNSNSNSAQSTSPSLKSHSHSSRRDRADSDRTMKTDRAGESTRPSSSSSSSSSIGSNARRRARRSTRDRSGPNSIHHDAISTPPVAAHQSPSNQADLADGGELLGFHPDQSQSQSHSHSHRRSRHHRRHSDHPSSSSSSSLEPLIDSSMNRASSTAIPPLPLSNSIVSESRRFDNFRLSDGESNISSLSSSMVNPILTTSATSSPIRGVEGGVRVWPDAGESELNVMDAASASAIARYQQQYPKSNINVITTRINDAPKKFIVVSYGIEDEGDKSFIPLMSPNPSSPSPSPLPSPSSILAAHLVTSPLSSPTEIHPSALPSPSPLVAPVGMAAKSPRLAHHDPIPIIPVIVDPAAPPSAVPSTSTSSSSAARRHSLHQPATTRRRAVVKSNYYTLDRRRARKPRNDEIRFGDLRLFERIGAGSFGEVNTKYIGIDYI